MAKKKATSTSPEVPPTSSQQPIPDGEPGIGSDLETLRDILYGNQARATEDRLSRLERELTTTRRDFGDQLKEQISSLRTSAASQLTATREELEQQLAKQDGRQTSNLNTAQEEFGVSLAKLDDEFKQELQQTQNDLNARLNKLETDLSERLQSIQEEALRRDGDLRQELLTLSAWLDDKKASRHDLGKMLAEIGQRLQAEAVKEESESAS